QCPEPTVGSYCQRRVTAAGADRREVRLLIQMMSKGLVLLRAVLLGALAVAATGELATAQFRTDPAIVSTAPLLAAQDYQLGVDAIRNGEYRKALQQFDGALTADPDYLKAHDGRGVALALLNRFAESEAAFVTAIRLDAKFAEPHFNLGK